MPFNQAQTLGRSSLGSLSLALARKPLNFATPVLQVLPQPVGIVAAPNRAMSSVPAVGAGSAGSELVKQVVTSVVGAGGGVAFGVVLGPKVGVSRKLGALLGGGTGLLAALLFLRWS